MRAEPADVEDAQERGGGVHQRLLAGPAAKLGEKHRDEEHRDQSRQVPFLGPVSALPRLETAGEVEAILGKPPSMIMLKQVGALDEG